MLLRRFAQPEDKAVRNAEPQRVAVVQADEGRVFAASTDSARAIMVEAAVGSPYVTSIDRVSTAEAARTLRRSSWVGTTSSRY